jgi:hypothetical protein
VLLDSVAVTYQSLAGTVEVRGMFDENYVLVQGSAHAGVEQGGPAVFLRIEDLPRHPDQDEPLLTILGKAYKIRERQPDGSVGGSIRLLLHVIDVPFEAAPDGKPGAMASLGGQDPRGEQVRRAPGQDMRVFLNQLGWPLLP